MYLVYSFLKSRYHTPICHYFNIQFYSNTCFIFQICLPPLLQNCFPLLQFFVMMWKYFESRFSSQFLKKCIFQGQLCSDTYYSNPVCLKQTFPVEYSSGAHQGDVAKFKDICLFIGINSNNKNSNNNTALVITIKVAITKKLLAVTECYLCSTYEKTSKHLKTPY